MNSLLLLLALAPVATVSPPATAPDDEVSLGLLTRVEGGAR